MTAVLSQYVLHTDALSVPKGVPTLLRVICSWCREVLQEGDPGALTTHTICPSCTATVEASMDERAFPGVPVEA